jgi:hypothetical protein
MTRTLILSALVVVSISCTLLGPGDQFAWSNPAAIENGGVVISIARLLIAEKTAFNADFLKEPYYDDKPVIAEIIFIVQNESSQIMNVFPDQGCVDVGGEQVDLSTTPTVVGDYLGGEILPGFNKVGGFWFGFKRTALDEIQNMEIVIAAPFDNFSNTLGQEYRFDIDLSERKNKAGPDELK